MNSKDFIQTLRKVIREEVQAAVRTELNNILNEGVVSKRPNVVEQKKPAPKTTYTSSVKKQYVKNSLLNDILNETSGHSPQGPMAMLEENIDYNDFSEWPTMQRGVSPSMKTKSVLPATDLEGRPVNPDNLPDEVVNALTKDYSALMKAIDKKKGK